MKFGITKFLTKIHLKVVQSNFTLRHKVLGFKNANNLMRIMDKRAVIPILRHNKATIGEGNDLESPLTFHNCQDYQNLYIGHNCHIGKKTFLDLRDKIILEDNVTVSMRTTFITHLDLFKSGLKNKYQSQAAPIRIGRNCYIGASATILMGVELGENCIVAAGSLVKDSFPPNTMIAGVPGKALKEV
jgi:acetyltransferase-like isoleucine patch superfamily enzyme